MIDDASFSIGELAQRTGLSVRTIRFYSDEGVVPVTLRSAAGHRRYDVDALARLDLVSTLRDLGLPLPTIRRVLDEELSLSQVAAAHAHALDAQINDLRLRRAVLRAVAKQTPTHEEARLMHQLAKMSAAERSRLIQDFIDDTFGDLDANPDFVAMMRAATPDLPDDPTPEQVQAWVDLAELVQDAGFRASVRRMAQHQADERAAGGRSGLHQELSSFVQETVTAAIEGGVDPGSAQAADVLRQVVARYALAFDAADSPTYRQSLVRRLEVGSDPRAERYWRLLGIITTGRSHPTSPRSSVG